MGKKQEWKVKKFAMIRKKKKKDKSGTTPIDIDDRLKSLPWFEKKKKKKKDKSGTTPKDIDDSNSGLSLDKL
jgi:hypothetical protein